MCDSPYSLYRVSGLGSLLALSGDSGGTGTSTYSVEQPSGASERSSDEGA